MCKSVGVKPVIDRKKLKGAHFTEPWHMRGKMEKETVVIPFCTTEKMTLSPSSKKINLSGKTHIIFNVTQS